MQRKVYDKMDPAEQMKKKAQTVVVLVTKTGHGRSGARIKASMPL